MITTKLILMIVSMTLTITAIVLGFWSYAIALRSTIRIKYFNYHSSDREKKIQLEYKRKLNHAITIFIAFVILLSVVAYLVVLLYKNDISLI